MSKAATRFPLRYAMPLAQELANAVADYSPRVHIAGSIRRARPDVGDVDLVVLDTGENPWLRSTVANRIASLGYTQTTDGQQIASFVMPDRPGLDVYYAAEETWGITLLARTGSAAHNIRLVQRGGRRLPARKFTLHGIEDTAGRVVGAKTEEDVFGALGLLFIDPKFREAPELEHLVRQETQ